MIVAPTFLDHWKVKLLETELGNDPCAAIYVLRLWSHCQCQKTHRFKDLSAAALSAICRFNGAQEQLWLAMQTAGFIALKGQLVEVHQWNEYNASLISAWKNGGKGGRPRKTQKKPTETHGLKRDNPRETDREEKIEKIVFNPTPTPSGSGEGEKTPQSPQPPQFIPEAPKPPKPDKTPAQRRAEALFRKRPETPWDRAELTAWRTAKTVVEATTEDAWAALEWWFALPPEKAEFRRKNFATLLNNWNGEIERAVKAKAAAPRFTI